MKLSYDNIGSNIGFNSLVQLHINREDEVCRTDFFNFEKALRRVKCSFFLVCLKLVASHTDVEDVEYHLISKLKQNFQRHSVH